MLGGYNYRMSARLKVMGLIGLGLVFLAGFLFVRNTPRLLEVIPKDGAQEVPATTPLRLRFSRPMLPASVEEHLAIIPLQAGSFSWEGTTLIFTPQSPWRSGATITVRLSAGARSAGWLPLALLSEQEWSFIISRPRLVYLYPADQPANLYALEPVSGAVEILSESLFGVLDFSVAPDGTAIYYSARNATGGSDILRLERRFEEAMRWVSTPILECPQALCRSPQPSPDGRWLAYERIPLAGSAPTLIPQVYLLALSQTGDAASTQPEGMPIGDPQHLTRLPLWSPAGLLSYYDIRQKAFVLFNPQDGTSRTLPNETGEPGCWSPDGKAFVAPEILFLGGEQSGIATSHLMRYERLSGSVQDLSQSPYLEDTSPLFSPDGTRLVLARKYLDAARWTPGRQIWLMSPDGKEVQALTNAPYFNHSSFAWSPDGRQLAYLRFNQEKLTDPPELWLMNADGSQPIQLVIGGYAPQWIP